MKTKKFNIDKTEDEPKAKNDKPHMKVFKTKQVVKPKVEEKKLTLEKKPLSPREKMKRRILWSVTFIALSILLALGIKYVAMPGYNIKTNFDDIVEEAKLISQELDNKDISRLSRRIGNITDDLDDINAEVDNLEFLKTLDLTKGYYDNLQILKKINEQTKVLLEKAMPEIEPILKTAGYKVESGEQLVVDEDQQVEAFLQQLPKLIELYENIEPQLLEIFAEVDKINPAYIPTVGDMDIKDDLEEFKVFTADFPEFSQELKAAMRVMPDLLGVGKPARYLIIFQNEKELRPSGGILTAYGNMSIKNGKLPDDIDAKDMWKLHYDLSNWGIYPPIYNKNGQLFLMVTNGGRCGAASTRPQDSGVYPDQYQDIVTFRQYYDRAATHRVLKKEYPDYDHVIMVNTLFASKIISFVEPIKIEEYKLTIDSKNMSKILTIHFNTEANITKTSDEERKDLIKYLASEVKEKIGKLSVSDLPTIIKGLLEEVQARHITFYSKNPDVQAYFDEMSMSGRTPVPNDFAGDYFQHSEGQYCSLKSNFYVTDTVTISLDVENDKSITHTANIEWQNPRVQTGVPHYIIDPRGQFPYVPWSRMLVPDGAKFVNSNSYQQSSRYYYSPKQYYDKELKAYVLDHVIRFDHVRKEGEPVKTKSYTTQYKLPSKYNYNAEKGYSLLLVKHAGKRDEKFVINFNVGGQSYRQELKLERDTILTFKDGVFTLTPYDTRLDEFIELTSKLTTMFPEEEETQPTE